MPVQAPHSAYSTSCSGQSGKHALRYGIPYVARVSVQDEQDCLNFKQMYKTPTAQFHKLPQIGPYTRDSALSFPQMLCIWAALLE